MNPSAISGLLRDTVPAGTLSGVTSLGGAALQIPPWLIALGQAMIVVWGVMAAIDRRRKQDRIAFTELAASVDTLTVRFNRLACQNGRPTPPPCA